MLKQIYFRKQSNDSAGPARHLPAMLVGGAGAGLLGLLLATAACSSDSKSDSSTAGKGGTSTSSAGGSADGGAPDSGGSSSGGSSTGGSSKGGTAAGGTATGGSAAGGTATGGTASGGATGSGGGIWGCVEAGGSCICQNNTDKQHESVCTATYECCFTLPFAGAIRCQCQDPGNTKCEAPAGSGAEVVDKCPPP
jgi:hypothetical protein